MPAFLWVRDLIEARRSVPSVKSLLPYILWLDAFADDLGLVFQHHLDWPNESDYTQP